jgi:hypothetical protein
MLSGATPSNASKLRHHNTDRICIYTSPHGGQGQVSDFRTVLLRQDSRAKAGGLRFGKWRAKRLQGTWGRLTWRRDGWWRRLFLRRASYGHES